MSNPEPLVAKDDQQEIKFDIMKRAALDFHETTPTSSSLLTKEGKGEEMRKETQEEEEKELGGGGDENDGFKTPTSLEHKIPEPKICPPALRRPTQLKRKAPPTHSSSAAALVVGNLLQLQLVFSKRVRKA